MRKIPWVNLYPRATPAALDLLERLLTFDPAIRITVEEALAHPYLEAYHDSDDEPTHPSLFDFAFEVVESIDEMKQMIAEEVVQFKRLTQPAGVGATLPRPKETLPGPSRDVVGNVEREDHDEPRAMDIDEELRMKGH
nr:Mitogen-activated protein kinase 14 [Polyrhizophydium stewartii]